jgi:hypothetical protein
MLRLMLAAALVFSCASLDVADAAAKRKRQKVRHVAPIAAVPATPYGLRTPGPVWAQPWECFTDEGYGRYTSCSTGKDD